MLSLSLARSLVVSWVVVVMAPDAGLLCGNATSAVPRLFQLLSFCFKLSWCRNFAVPSLGQNGVCQTQRAVRVQKEA